MLSRFSRVVLVLLVIAGSACQEDRGPAYLRYSTFGRISARGSVLAYEAYTPPTFYIDGTHCPRLDRTFVSNDANAFFEAIKAIAQYHPRTSRIPAELVFNEDEDRGAGRHPRRIDVGDVDSTNATIWFWDVDDPNYERPDWVDARAWRFVIQVEVHERLRPCG